MLSRQSEFIKKAILYLEELKKRTTNPVEQKNIANSISTLEGLCCGFSSFWLFAMKMTEQPQIAGRPRDDITWFAKTFNALLQFNPSEFDRLTPEQKSDFEHFISHLIFFQNTGGIFYETPNSSFYAKLKRQGELDKSLEYTESKKGWDIVAARESDTKENMQPKTFYISIREEAGKSPLMEIKFVVTNHGVKQIETRKFAIPHALHPLSQQNLAEVLSSETKRKEILAFLEQNIPDIKMLQKIGCIVGVFSPQNLTGLLDELISLRQLRPGQIILISSINHSMAVYLFQNLINGKLFAFFDSNEIYIEDPCLAKTLPSTEEVSSNFFRQCWKLDNVSLAKNLSLLAKIKIFDFDEHAREGHPVMDIQALLTKFSETEYIDETGTHRNPIWEAVIYGNYKNTAYFLENGANPNLPGISACGSSYPHYPLIEAIRCCRSKFIVELLIQHGASINEALYRTIELMKEPSNISPLKGVEASLIQRGATLDEALFVAYKKNDKIIADCLKAKGAKLSGDGLRLDNYLKIKGKSLNENGLISADLSGADLSGIDLSGADLHGANLCGANLRSANIMWSNFDGAVFDEFALESIASGYSGIKINLGKIKIVGEIHSPSLFLKLNLSAAAFHQVNLSKVNLSSNELTGFDFNEANLSCADLRSCVLTSANLCDANLHRANLSGARLFGAIFTGANLKEVYIDGALLFAKDLKKIILQQDLSASLSSNTALLKTSIDILANFPGVSKNPLLELLLIYLSLDAAGNQTEYTYAVTLFFLKRFINPKREIIAASDYKEDFCFSQKILFLLSQEISRKGGTILLKDVWPQILDEISKKTELSKSDKKLIEVLQILANLSGYGDEMKNVVLKLEQKIAASKLTLGSVLLIPDVQQTIFGYLPEKDIRSIGASCQTIHQSSSAFWLK